jgi:methyl-accepting chemotaxis protein
LKNEELINKKKLIIAFSIIATVILLSTVYNNYGIYKSSNGFTSYRTMAKNSLLTSNIQTSILMELNLHLKNIKN